MAGDLWVVVLAAGEGRRLGGLATHVSGVTAPKQFCSFGRREPMIRWALARATAVVPRERVLVVVAEEHRHFWQPELGEVPGENVVVQPRNRGTAPGVLLPLIEVLKRDPDAYVAFLPSDHYVEDEEKLAQSLVRSAELARDDPGRIVLLGITPEGPETEYGWILPSRERSRRSVAVGRFVEKPDAETAAELQRRGAVWNSFVFVACGEGLLLVYGDTLPALQEALLRELVVLPREAGLAELYATLPSSDFCRDVLQRVPDRLHLVVVPPCGWTDLGTPARLQSFLARRRRTGTSRSSRHRIEAVAFDAGVTRHSLPSLGRVEP